jgi:hypothetical protein
MANSQNNKKSFKFKKKNKTNIRSESKINKKKGISNKSKKPKESAISKKGSILKFFSNTTNQNYSLLFILTVGLILKFKEIKSHKEAEKNKTIILEKEKNIKNTLQNIKPLTVKYSPDDQKNNSIDMKLPVYKLVDSIKKSLFSNDILQDPKYETKIEENNNCFIIKIFNLTITLPTYALRYMIKEAIAKNQFDNIEITATNNTLIHNAAVDNYANSIINLLYLIISETQYMNAEDLTNREYFLDWVNGNFFSKEPAGSYNINVKKYKDKLVFKEIESKPLSLRDVYAILKKKGIKTEGFKSKNKNHQNLTWNKGELEKILKNFLTLNLDKNLKSLGQKLTSLGIPKINDMGAIQEIPGEEDEE